MGRLQLVHSLAQVMSTFSLDLSSLILSPDFRVVFSSSTV